MSVAADPLASLRSWGLSVTLGGRDYDIQPRSGTEWLTILIQDPLDLGEVLPGMLSDADAETLEEALLGGLVTEKEVTDVAFEVIASAAGREWWWALNLIQSVASVWVSVYGQLVAQGVRFDLLPLGAILDAMYATVAARMDKERLRTFDSDLDRPPSGHAPELSAQEEETQFLALMNGQ